MESASVLHRDHVWHDLVQVWQTPGRGEERMAALPAGDPDEPGFPHRWMSEDPAAGAAVLRSYGTSLDS